MHSVDGHDVDEAKVSLTMEVEVQERCLMHALPALSCCLFANTTITGVRPFFCR
jgi:hypothetical protein